MTRRPPEADDLNPVHRRSPPAKVPRRPTPTINGMATSIARDTELVSVAQLVQDSAPLITAGLPSRVFLALELDHQAPPVLADLGQIQQVLLNLCVNSAHAIGETTGTIRLGVAERVVAGPAAGAAKVPPGRYLSLTVADTGCGMTAEVSARIFEPFFTTKKEGEGTGLGLAMVQEIVAEHGGSITVRSAPGEGTTFEVLLPAAPAAPA